MPIKDHSSFTGLILLSGEDQPGIAAKLMELLSQFSVSILDIQQLVTRGRLILTVLIKLDESHAQAIAEELEMAQGSIGADIAIDFAIFQSTSAEKSNLQITIVEKELKPSTLLAVIHVLTNYASSILDISCNSHHEYSALNLEIACSSDLIPKIRKEIFTIAAQRQISIAVQTADMTKSLKRLVLLDMDSTLIQQEVIDLIAAKAGVELEVSAITKRAMAGEIDFRQALKERVALLAGLEKSALDTVKDEIQMMLGADTLFKTLKQHRIKIGVVSGGFLDVIEPLMKKLEVDFYVANKLEIIDGKMTGQLEGEIIDAIAKLEALKRFADQEKIELGDTVAIGDGANDIDMIRSAGLGIAFNAKPLVTDVASAVINVNDLSIVLLLMQIPV